MRRVPWLHCSPQLKPTIMGRSSLQGLSKTMTSLRVSISSLRSDPRLTTKAPWMRAWKDGRGRSFPNTIAHRGLNVAYPENSMAAFKGAVKVGAHALETDIHISKDNVLVLSHVSYTLFARSPFRES